MIEIAILVLTFWFLAYIIGAVFGTDDTVSTDVNRYDVYGGGE